MLPNCPQYIIAAFAILRIGAIVVNVNPIYTAREISAVATDSGMRMSDHARRARAARARRAEQTAIEHIIVTSLAEYSAAGRRAAASRARWPSPTAGRRPTGAPVRASRSIRDDVAVLQYTGGTTGTPKGAMLTHDNIFANVVQTETLHVPARARAAKSATCSSSRTFTSTGSRSA